ncbi:MAG: hypothetical protein ABSH25_17600 [Syntrophorhabdales bacterium]
MIYIVRVPFRAKSGEIKKGQVIAMPENSARTLLAAGTIDELRPCHICGQYAWYLSKTETLRCGVCHPPKPEAVKKWIGDPECYATLKATMPNVLFSWVEAVERRDIRQTEAQRNDKEKAS